MELLNGSGSENKDVVRITRSYYTEAKEAKRNRMELNQANFDAYHLKQDWSHKKTGQSKEFLPKQSMAVEQITSFIQQGLVDINEWFSVEKKPGIKDETLTEKEIFYLLGNQLDKANMVSFIADALKLGLIGSLMITKVHGKYAKKPIFYSEKKVKGDKVVSVLKREDRLVWELCLSLVRQEDYYPDPSGRGLYELQEINMDLHEVIAMSKGENAIYDPEAVALLGGGTSYEDPEQVQKKSQETAQVAQFSAPRKLVKLTEGWGTIISSTGEVLFEDVTWTVANDSILIQKPTKNPFWHGESPYVTSPIVRVPHSVWHKALMDGPTRHNMALNELYNLILDSGIMATFGIKQLHPEWLENESQVDNGIAPGTTLEVNSNCPPGAKVLERVDTSTMSQESINVFNMTVSEFQQSALTNDLRLGVLPARAVKATEVVEASNSITSVFTGVAKTIEGEFVRPLLAKAWLTIAQHLKDLDPKEVGALLGQDRADLILALDNEEIFAAVAMNHAFNVFGVSRTLNKVKDFRKLTALLQTISGSEVLVEEFVKRYDFGKLLEQIMKSLDINVDQIKQDENDQVINQMAGAAGGIPTPGSSPDMQSQTPQASSGNLNPTVQSMLPSTQFPASRATPKAGG